MTKTKELMVGDYVEVLDGASGGVEIGEQGMVINAESQQSLGLIFPARTDFWAEANDQGWLVMAKQLKLLYRLRI